VRLAAVATVKNEADIIGATVAHLLEQGIGSIYIYDGMSTDGTRDVLARFPVKVYDDTSPIHRQPALTSELAHMAYAHGADWVIPFDADEFWVAPESTLAEAFASVGPDVGVLEAVMFQYINFDYREPPPKPLSKVAFRATDGATVGNGNHSVSGVAGATLRGVLEVCEVQYRGFEHFCRKIVDRNATLDPSLPPGEGTHHAQYHGWTKEQLEPVWQAMVDRATVLDPIPLRR
jgi:glycosyltransferase involved in cell wall biosynthesis